MKKTIVKKVLKQKKLASDPSALMQTERDFKDSVLMVSVFVNLFLLCLWVALQTTTQYDSALISFFIHR